MNNGLGRRPLPDGDTGHLEKYPIRTLLPETIATVERTLALPYTYRSKYDQGQEGACFPAGTLVQLSDGTWRPIDQLRLLDDVRTAEGNIGKVHQTMVRWHDAGLVRVRLRGHTGVRMTPEHPVLTKHGYVAAKDLHIGDLVALTRATHETPGGHIDVRAHLPEAIARRARNGTRMYHDRHGGTTAVQVAAVPDTLPVTTKLGRLFGIYLAEGHTTEQKVTWTFGGHEKDTLAAETVQLVSDALGAEAHTQYRPNGSINVVLYGKRWRHLFEDLCGTGSQAKRIPAEFSSDAPEVRRAVLDGWLAGDGHRRRTEVMGVTISPQLAFGMYGIAADLGLYPTISRSTPSPNRHAATRQERWEVHIPEGDGHRPEMDDRAVWRCVNAVEHEDWSGFVYNIAVAGDQSYVAEGFGVHNCVGYASSWMMSILNRRYYDARWLWNEAKKTDEWADTNPGDSNGTSVRAGMEILRSVGHTLLHGHAHEHAPLLEDGIREYRWATRVDEVRTCIAAGVPVTLGVDWMSAFDTPKRKSEGSWWIGEGDLGQVRGGHAICAYGASDRRQAVKLTNSWGKTWPLVWVPYATLQRLLDGIQYPGEAAIVTDRIEP